MNKDNAHEFIPLIQALGEGEIIQKGDGKDWIDLTVILFYDGPENYRVKPKKPIIGRLFGYYEIAGIQLTKEVKDALETAGISYADK